MIIKHYHGYLEAKEVAEIGRMFAECTASHNARQMQDTTLLHALFGSSVFKKLKESILQDYYVCEAWFIIGEKYSWHSDAHVDLFSDQVINLWIPYELSTDRESPVMEYYEENATSGKRLRESRLLIRSLIAARSWASALPTGGNLARVTERLFAKLAGVELRAIRQAEVGDVLVLNPSYLHRSGTRKKKVLAIQCVPKSVLTDPSLANHHSAITSRVARKALAAIPLQRHQEANGEA